MVERLLWIRTRKDEKMAVIVIDAEPAHTIISLDKLTCNGNARRPCTNHTKVALYYCAVFNVSEINKHRQKLADLRILQKNRQCTYFNFSPSKKPTIYDYNFTINKINLSLLS